MQLKMRALHASVLAAVVGCGSAQALAHAAGLAVGPDDLWHHWTFDPFVLAPLLVAHWLYGRGVLRLWARAGRGRGIGVARVAAFVLGEAVLIAALVSPLDALSETLLSAHMAQHLLLVAAAPLLLLAGQPATAFAWAIADGQRQKLARDGLVRGLGRRLAWTLRPLPAAALHAVAMWLWHTPALFTAALASPVLHFLEHASYFGTALLFWYALERAARSPMTAPAGIAAAFLTLLQCGLLGTIITFAPAPLYAAGYGDRALLWGLSPIEDQELAGLLMGAPLMALYILACLRMAAVLLEPRPHAPPRV
jgi:putative membrane protein